MSKDYCSFPEDLISEKSVSGESLADEALPDESLPDESLPDESLPDESSNESPNESISQAALPSTATSNAPYTNKSLPHFPMLGMSYFSAVNPLLNARFPNDSFSIGSLPAEFDSDILSPSEFSFDAPLLNEPLPSLSAMNENFFKNLSRGASLPTAPFSNSSLSANPLSNSSFSAPSHSPLLSLPSLTPTPPPPLPLQTTCYILLICTSPPDFDSTHVHRVYYSRDKAQLELLRLMQEEKRLLAETDDFQDGEYRTVLANCTMLGDAKVMERWTVRGEEEMVKVARIVEAGLDTRG
jgi:hypothetical protein